MTITKTNICNQSCIALGSELLTDVDTDSTKRARVLKELYDIKLNWLLRKYEWKFATKRVQLTPIEYLLNFDAQVDPFVFGEIVSGAVGVGTVDHLLMLTATTGVLYLKTVTVGFVDDENITGNIAGDADANGVEVAATPINEFDYIYALPTDYLKLISLYPEYLQYRLESNFILSGESSTLDIKYTFKALDPNQFDSTFVEAFAALLAREACVSITDSSKKEKKLDELFEDKIADARFSGSIEDDLESVEADEWLSERI